jgi:hypothetical protein
MVQFPTSCSDLKNIFQRGMRGYCIRQLEFQDGNIKHRTPNIQCNCRQDASAPGERPDCRRSEVGGQRPEVGRQNSECRDQKKSAFFREIRGLIRVWCPGFRVLSGSRVFNRSKQSERSFSIFVLFVSFCGFEFVSIREIRVKVLRHFAANEYGGAHGLSRHSSATAEVTRPTFVISVHSPQYLLRPSSAVALLRRMERTGVLCG